MFAGHLPWRGWFQYGASVFKRRKLWLIAFIILGVLAGVGAGVAMTLDNAGWLPRHRDTDMYLGTAEWTDGTFRNCVALPVRDGSILFMGCVQGAENYLSPETVRIRYWGRITRPDRFDAAMSQLNAWKWRCQRTRDDVTCWAVN